MMENLTRWNQRVKLDTTPSRNLPSLHIVMFISFPILSLLACTASDDAQSQTVFVDGELFALDLRVITPKDQVIDRIGKINELNLIVRQSDGTTSSHSMTGDYALNKAENNVIPPLDEAQLSLVGTYTEGDRTTVVYHGTSAPVTIEEGTLTVPIFVAKNDHIGRLGNLATPSAFASIVAVGEGRFYAFGGAEDGVASSESTTVISHLDLSNPNPNLSVVSSNTALPSQPNGTGWLTHTADVIASGQPHAGEVLLAGGGPVFPTIDDGTLGPTHATDKAYRFNPKTEELIEVNSMNYARFDHRSALLSTGEVVVTGGFDKNGSPVEAVDIYSPETDTWTTQAQGVETGSVFHAMARYGSEGVLVCGGLTAGEFSEYSDQCTLIRNTYEIEPAQPMEKALLFSNMVTLDDGRILRTGGLDATEHAHTTYRPENMRSTADAAIFEDGEWRPLSAPLKRARAMHTTTLLPGGRVLIVGGVSGISSEHTAREADYNGLLYDHAEALACVEIFDPETEAFALEDPACQAMETEGTLPQRTLLAGIATDPTYGTLIYGGVGSDRGDAVDTSLVYHPSYASVDQVD